MCSVPGCENKVVSYGLCDKHRKRKKRNGSEYIHINQPWGNARTIRADGYIYITVAGEQVMEHRHIMEEHLGRKLYAYEVVHHKDRNKRNNDISNLEVMLWSEHSSYHAKNRHTGRAAHKETIKRED